MNTKTRIEKIEEQLTDSTESSPWLEHFLQIADIVYDDQSEAERAKRLAALPPMPVPATPDERAMAARLVKIYGD